MTVTHILVTNVLPTGTAFGVLVDNHGESVFIPARINASMPARLVVGQRLRALIIPNQSHQDRTPWIVLRLEPEAEIETVQLEPRTRTLSDEILEEIAENGSATLYEIADSIGHHPDLVRIELENLVQDNRIFSLVVYDLTDPLSVGAKGGGA